MLPNLTRMLVIMMSWTLLQSIDVKSTTSNSGSSYMGEKIRNITIDYSKLLFRELMGHLKKNNIQQTTPSIYSGGSVTLSANKVSSIVSTAATTEMSVDNTSKYAITESTTKINVPEVSLDLPKHLINCTNDIEKDQYCVNDVVETTIQDRIDQLLSQTLNDLTPVNSDLILEAINKTETSDNFPHEPRDHINYTPACYSKVESLSPKFLTGQKGDIFYVINSKKYHIRQRITVEQCVNIDSSCNLKGVSSRCRQNFVKRSFFVMDSTGAKMLRQEHFFPSSCTCYIKSFEDSIIDPCRKYRTNDVPIEDSNLYHQEEGSLIKHLGDILGGVVRKKRDTLDHFSNNNNQLDSVFNTQNSFSESNSNSFRGNDQQPISSHHTLGSIIGDFVSGRTSFFPRKKKQLVCFTQNYDDDLKRNLESAIQFNAVIDQNSRNDFIRNNRNTEPAPSRASFRRSIDLFPRDSGDQKRGLKDWLDLSRQDITFLAKHLNQQLTESKQVTPPTSVLSPPNRIESFDDSFFSPNNIGDQNVFESVLHNTIEKPQIDESLLNIQNNGFQPFQPSDRDHFINNMNENTIGKRSFNTNTNENSIQDLNPFHENSRFGDTNTAESLVDSIVDDPSNGQHLRQLLFPGRPGAKIHVEKARHVFEKSLRTRRNDRVNIHTYHQ